MSALTGRKIFADAAARVARQLAIIAGFRVLEQTAALVFASAFAAWLVLRLSGVRDEAWWALSLICVWLLGVAAYAWLRRPMPFAALAAWDRAAAARETLASAWSFEQAGSTEAGAALHLARAGEHLTARRVRLARDLPLRFAPAALIAPLCFLGFVLSGWLRAPLAQEDPGLSAETRARASAAGRELVDQAKIIAPLKSLTEEEKQK